MILQAEFDCRIVAAKRQIQEVVSNQGWVGMDAIRIPSKLVLPPARSNSDAEAAHEPISQSKAASTYTSASPPLCLLSVLP